MIFPAFLTNVSGWLGTVYYLFRKAKLQENLDFPLHGANLLTGDGGSHLGVYGILLSSWRLSAHCQVMN